MTNSIHEKLFALFLGAAILIPYQTAGALPDWKIDDAQQELHKDAQTAKQSASGIPIFKAETRLVTMDVTVREKDTGKPNTDFKITDFELFEDKKPRQIKVFKVDEDPLAVAIVLDKSGSIIPYVQSLQDSAERALALLKPKDMVSLYAFDWGVEQIVGLTTDRSRIREGIRQVQAGGMTNLNDAIYLVSRELKATAPKGARRAIILISDNEPTFICGDPLPTPPQATTHAPISNFPFPGRFPQPGQQPTPTIPGTDPNYDAAIAAYNAEIDAIKRACGNPPGSDNLMESAHHKEVVETALEADVTVYSVKIPGMNAVVKGMYLGMGGGIVDLIHKGRYLNVKGAVDETGGELFKVQAEVVNQPTMQYPSPADSNATADSGQSPPELEGRPQTVFEALQAAVEHLRRRYTVGFYSPESAKTDMEPGKEFRRLTLKFHDKKNDKRFIIRTRKGYYPKPRFVAGEEEPHL